MWISFDKVFLPMRNAQNFTALLVYTPLEQLPFSIAALHLYNSYFINSKWTSYILIVLPPIIIFENNLLLIPNLWYRFVTYKLTYPCIWKLSDWLLPKCLVLVVSGFLFLIFVTYYFFILLMKLSLVMILDIPCTLLSLSVMTDLDFGFGFS